MTVFAYVTDNCNSDAVHHSLTVEVERFKDRVESTQTTSLFDPFPPPYLVKKKVGGRQGRLIAERRVVGEHAVIVFLAILIRSSRAYEEEFTRNPLEYGNRHFRDLVSEDDLRRYVDSRTSVSPPPVKPAPSDAEYGLLYGAFSHHRNSAGDLVCETKEWVEQVTQERIAKQLALLCPACLTALGKSPGLHRIPVPNRPGWGIWAMRSESRLLLITPFTEVNEARAQEYAKKTESELTGKDATAILRASRRAYPALILADDELWIDLEKEPVANMALSPEESEVLESARSSDNPFPLFINGRAGSGKSTILQYLFSDLLFHYLATPEAKVMAPPVYLTANGELLRVARGFVERLLRSEVAFVQAGDVDLANENRELLDEAFREFQPHLLSLVPQEERSKRFPRAARVDYSRFRRMWMDRFGKDKHALRDFGPDLSWHVIRSYVKGMSSEGYLEPDDYAQLPENQITVTHEAFKYVYERVWTGWYKQELDDAELWDDQDLTRYVLENHLAKPTYPVIFCDEAQDFTRLELELLLRTNLFSNRTIPPNDISRVPFAFAGDQFQTLNPTGFRWDSIKASFVEKFIFELDPARRSGRTDLNYRELKYNYRSTHKIVRFGNNVQALRAALFELPDLKPQIPWATEPVSFPVVWFRSNDAEFWKRYREHGRFVVIVPCSEGEEIEYVQNDPILSERIRTEDGIPLNVLSAGRAKGCEYPEVIVYGFGAESPTDVLAKLRKEDGMEHPDPDRSLPIQYFINRLYVAVSRPKRRLVVVDTDEGFARLWRCTQEEAAERSMLSKIKNGGEIWGGEIEGMTIGHPDDLTRENAGDPLENAKAFETEGIARRDSFLLKQAALAYRSGGDTAKSKECRARAFEADGLFLEAGEAYLDAGFVPKGVECLWRAGRKGWAVLCEKLALYPQIQSEIEFQWARGIVGKGKPSDLADLLDRFANRLEDAAFRDRCTADLVWREALDGLLGNVNEASNAHELITLARRMTNALDRIQERGIDVPASKCAPVFFAAARHAEAIAFWDAAGATKSSEYLRAKASVEPYPQRIVALSKLGLDSEIVEAYAASPDVPLNADQADAVVDVLRRSVRPTEAYELACMAGSPDSMLRFAADFLESGDKSLAAEALDAAVILCVRHKQWERVASLVTTRKFFDATGGSIGEPVAKFVTSSFDRVQVTLVQALARSEELSGAPAHLQRKLSDFLRNYLRVKDGRWKSRLTVAEAGAAIERAGRFTDAIAFYEAVAKESGDREEDRKLSQQRWLVNKERQLKHEQSSGDLNKVRKIESEIKEAISSLSSSLRVGTTTEDLTQFPVLMPLPLPRFEPSSRGKAAKPSSSPILRQPTQKIAVTSPETLDIALGPFKVEVSRKNRRINITNTETMETAYIKIAEGKCGGEVKFNQPEKSKWVCPLWNLSVSFPSGSETRLLIDAGGLGASVLLDA